MDLFLAQFAKLFPELNLALGAGIMVFSRLLGLMQFAPPFNRKEVPSLVRLVKGQPDMLFPVPGTGQPVKSAHQKQLPGAVGGGKDLF